MSRYYEILVDGNTVYAATDPRRFSHEIAKKYANVRNATVKMPAAELDAADLSLPRTAADRVF